MLLFGRLLQVPAAELENQTAGHLPSIVPSAESAPIAAYSGTAAKGKPKKQRLREDWNNDTSLHHDVANAVAAVERRRDEEAIAWSLKRDGFGRSLLNAPTVTISPRVMLPRDPEAARPAPAIPTKRELQRRLSKRQRQIIRAFDLWKVGLKWDEIAKVMDVPRTTVRSWRAEIASLLGEYELIRKNRPRDPETKRFVGREEKPRTSSQPA